MLCLAAHLRELRAARGINQETAAVSASLSFKSYQRLESSAAGVDVKVSTIARLAALYGVEVHELLVPIALPSRLNPGRPPKAKRSPARPVGEKRPR